MLKVGDKVRHKEDGAIGKVIYSTFGLSVSGITYNEDGTPRHHWQTLGEPAEVVEQYWEKMEDGDVD